MKKLLLNLWAVFFAAVTATASDPTFTPSIYLEPGKSYVFENCDAPTSLNRFLCDRYYNKLIGWDNLILTEQICMECIWTVIDIDSNGGYIIQNAATGSYLFKSDQPWSNSVYLSDEPGTVYINNYGGEYPSSIKFYLSRNGTGESFICAEAYGYGSSFLTTYSGNRGTSWYAYEVNPDEDIIFTQHKAYIPQQDGYILSFVKPVSNIVFSSSNPQIADISSTGEILVNAPGTTTVTATRGEQTDTCCITVLNTPTSFEDEWFEIDNVFYRINTYLDGVTTKQTSRQNVVSIENLEIPDSIDIEGFTYPVTEIGSYTFRNTRYSLSGSLTLGKNLRFIADDAFYNNCANISIVISKNPCPPYCQGNPFYTGSSSATSAWKQNTVLMVPAESVAAYSATKPWNEFKEIRSIEPLEGIQFADANVVCPLGGTVRLKVNKTPFGATGDITFISGNTAVATVDANGVVTGVAKGSTAIIAMSGTLTATCVVTVEDPTIAATSLEFEGIIGNVGERVAIGAKVLPADVTDPTISWQSSNPEVAAVDQEGSVWFNAAGSATVTAECQGYEFSVPFVVKEVIAHALNVFPVEAVGGVGHEFSLLALHEPENTTDKSVTWESSDPEVATVSEDGRVSLAAIGSAQITARSGEHSAVCAVTVDETVGLTEMASTGVVIDVVEGGIVVRNAPEGESIAVYAVDGKVVNGAVVEGEETKLNLAAGIYIVKVSPATVGKVLIK
ncbi:MAG: hypothetical protein HDR45_06985 [Bacteroides sp.]|nr:hypothetical protein [Bacteroides sp.]